MWNERRLPLPAVIAVENDANVEARGEMLRGVGLKTGCHSLLYIHWSAGLSASLVLDDAIWRGAHDRAGELGHVKVAVDARQQRALGFAKQRAPCSRCGQIDCLDACVNTTALAERVGAADLGELLDRAAAGDASARKALHAGAHLVGRAVGPLAAMLDIQKVVIGGRVGRDAFDMVATGIGDGLEEAATNNRRAALPVERTLMGENAAALGAALWALDGAGLRYLARNIR
jgi:predicted NBD/HSP70 family sugar kinase